VLDSIGSEYKPESIHHRDNGPKDDFIFQELSVPRRPAWDENTTPDQLHQLENESFIAWRRAIAEKEEQMMAYQSSLSLTNKKTVTPFEKNLQVWRQLWRVLERSSCVIQIVDARNPLFYLSQDLRTYVVDELDKPMLVVLNKSDYLTEKQRRVWHDYLNKKNIEHLFFSAYEEQKKLDDMATILRRGGADAGDEDKEEKEIDTDENIVNDDNKGADGEEKEEKEVDNYEDIVSNDNKGVDALLTREQLLSALQSFAAKNGCEGDERYDNRVQYGMVGFPNVGKSSVINVLVGSSKHAHGIVRVGVAAQPGKTKHFQTLLLPDVDEMILCDCPGLVFPSFVSSTADLIAAGVYPIAQMKDYWHVVKLICQRIPREVLNVRYGIKLPVPSIQDLKERGITKGDVDSGTALVLPPPTAEELLGTYCVARGMLAAASGVPDYQRASRIIIKEYVDGKLLFCHPPPNLTTASDNVVVSAVDGSAKEVDVLDFYRETLQTTFRNTKKLRDKLEGLHQIDNEQYISEDDEDETGSESEGGDEDHILLEDDLDILDIVGGIAGKIDNSEKNGGKRGKAHKSMKKWGKKGRKDRNKDPYGCHSEPDAMLVNGSSGGVYVNAGKYGTSGYTRFNHAGARAAIPSEGGKKSRRKRGEH